MLCLESQEVTAIMSSLIAELKEEQRQNLMKIKTDILGSPFIVIVQKFSFSFDSFFSTQQF